MGSSRWDDDTYIRSSNTRQANNIPDFQFTQSATRVHKAADPRRINSKPFGKLESRDSIEHPNSNAIILATDVTGSNIHRAQEVQKKLPNLMGLLTKYIQDPQIAIWANDDYLVQGLNSIQMFDFESGNEIDEWIRSLWLTGDGGGNNRESYDLLLYGAARKTVIDCFEKRNKKGYMFMYADENIPYTLMKNEVLDVFGDKIEADIPIIDVIEEARKMWDIWAIWPLAGYPEAKERQIELLGEDYVLTLEHPNMICELVAAIVGMNENKVSAAQAVDDLVATGVDRFKAQDIAGLASTALVKVGSNTSVVKRTKNNSGGASRL